jgi:hypothetical protein
MSNLPKQQTRCSNDPLIRAFECSASSDGRFQRSGPKSRSMARLRGKRLGRRQMRPFAAGLTRTTLNAPVLSIWKQGVSIRSGPIEQSLVACPIRAQKTCATAVTHGYSRSVFSFCISLCSIQALGPPLSNVRQHLTAHAVLLAFPTAVRPCRPRSNSNPLKLACSPTDS